MLTSNISISQWSNDPSENLKVLHSCINPWIVSDGDGGAIIVGWSLTINPMLYAQRVDKYGNILWDPTLRGIRVSTVGDEQWKQIMAPDGNGGVYIGFQEMNIIGRWDEPPEPIYSSLVRIQHIDADGKLLLGQEGLPLYLNPIDSLAASQTLYSMVSDNLGGVYVLWADLYGPQGFDRYVTYISPNGHISWENSVALNASNYTVVERDFFMYVDENNGLILYIHDYPNHRLVRINNNGEVTFEKIMDIELSPFFLFSATDGECILFWQDFTQSSNPDTIRCQKIDRNGEKLWGAEPIIIDSSGIVKNPIFIGIASDLRGGAYISYYHYNDT